MGERPLRFAFAGDRDISVRVLDYLLEEGYRPLLLMVSGSERATHANELIRRCPFLRSDHVFEGTHFRSSDAIAILRSLDLDLVVGIHFPYLVPAEVLSVPRMGVLNLHPAFLPFGRGWHTPSWAILEETPIGATLHFMVEEMDAGEIVHQRRLYVSPGDTADSLYARLKDLEFEVFREAWPAIAAGSCTRIPQAPGTGTMHKKADLFAPQIQRIDLDDQVRAGDLLRKLRALTTSQWDEAAYFDTDGKRYRVRVVLREDPLSATSAGGTGSRAFEGGNSALPPPARGAEDQGERC